MMKHEQYEQNTVVGLDIPSFKNFREEIIRIYPEGNLLLAYEKIIHLITQVKTCEDGRPITYKLIIDKFTTHISAWNIQYGDREPKYIGRNAEEKRKNLQEFVSLKWYEREFSFFAGKSDRNQYLFGEFTINYLKNRLDKFKRRIRDETSK